MNRKEVSLDICVPPDSYQGLPSPLRNDVRCGRLVPGAPSEGVERARVQLLLLSLHLWLLMHALRPLLLFRLLQLRPLALLRLGLLNLQRSNVGGGDISW